MNTEKKTIDPNYIEIVNLFNGACVYKVPKYQRGYAWESSEVEEFCNDVFDCLDAYKNDDSLEHFFGGVVCIEEKPETLKQTYKCFSIVDGQQRISTFLLFISAITKRLKKIKEGIDNQYEKGIGSLIENFEKKYLYYFESRNLEELRYKKLSMSIKDQEFYSSIVYEDIKTSPVTDSHRRIASAFKIINDKLGAKTDGMDFLAEVSLYENIDALLSTKCHVLKITTNKTEDAYRLFQVLNDRGRALSACDLLRASSLSRFENFSDSKLQDSAAKIWDEITQDRELDVEKYLSFYYVSITSDKLKKLDLFNKFNREFFDDVEPKLVYDRLSNISENLKLIKQLEDGDWPYEKPSVSEWNRQRLKFLIVRLKHTECIPLLLAATKLKETKFSELVLCLERFFFRFKTVLGKRFDPVVKVYLSEIQKINMNPDIYAIQSIQVELRKITESRTTDEEFRQAIGLLEFSDKESSDGTNGNRIIKYLLLQFEENFSWLKSNDRSLKNRDKLLDKSHVLDFPMVSIEHIYPQKSKSGNAELERLKNRVENLTLLDRNINSQLGNKPFHEKRLSFKESKFKINNEIANFESWNEQSLLERKRIMLDSVIDLFRV